MNEKKPISLLIIIFTLALFCSYHIYYHFVNIANDNLVRNYYDKSEVVNNSQTSVKKLNTENEKEEYLGILTIPKINLKTGFYDINSKNNNVNRNVTLLKDSIMPGDDGSIVYLAAHSGSGPLAYFKDLDKLTDNDNIMVNYHNHNYNYIISSIYEMPKNGEIIVNRNINENTLVLTTCSKNENMQLIILAKMINAT